MLQGQIRQALALTNPITTTSTRRGAIRRSTQVVFHYQVPTRQMKRLETQTLTLNLFPPPTPRSARILHATVRSRHHTLLDRHPHGPAALPVRTLRLAHRYKVAITTTTIIDASPPRSDIVATDGALEDGEGSEGLIVRDLVAGVVDAGEGEDAGLFGLAVDEGVRGADVHVARCRGASGEEGIVGGFAAKPVGW